MENFVVIKRDGSTEELNVHKIKGVIQWACEGLDVNPLALESKVETLVSDRITTVEIHDHIIHHAQSLATKFSPDWVYVAGRLNTMKRWKDTLAYEMEFKTYYHEMRESGKYCHPSLDKYTDEELDFLEAYLKQERDLSHSYGSTLTANRKYLLEGECIQQMFMVEAMIIFHSKPLEKVIELYNALSLRKISLATPWLSNLRSNGNISSCFIISIDDNTDSITEAFTKAVNISRMGGGLGIYLGNLRAKGSSIAGRDNSSKSVCIAAKVFNDLAIYFDQGGKRAGAFTLALPIWHNDIGEFLEIQSETGDQRSKAHDIFPQVCVPDLFMEKDKGDREWYTFCPHELLSQGLDIREKYGEDFEEVYLKAVELYKEGKISIVTKHDTRDLIKHIMRTQFESGLPYVAFVDTINKHNPNKHKGTIPCVNLCVESFSTLNATDWSHTCNLASVVNGRMDSYEVYSYYAGLLVEVLDAGIDLTNPPHASSLSHNNTFRTIGIGQQGVHDWLAKKGTSYNNLEELSKISEYIQYGAVKKSVELAKEKGAYPAFEGSMWQNGARLKSFSDKSVSDLDWSSLQKEVDLYGIRNSQLTSPAPNTSTSVFMDAAAGVMPVFSSFFREDNDNGKYPVSCMFAKDKILFYDKSFRTYDQCKLVESVAAIQNFTDTGISAEYLLDQNNPNFSAKSLYDLLHKAWKEETKAVYYIRSIKKGETVEDLLGIKEEGCEGCGG